jgi:polyphosphate glucokinase
VVARLRAALLPDYVVLGGGNVKKLKVLPEGARPGSNENAFRGGFRMWEGTAGAPTYACPDSDYQPAVPANAKGNPS